MPASNGVSVSCLVFSPQQVRSFGDLVFLFSLFPGVSKFLVCVFPDRVFLFFFVSSSPTFRYVCKKFLFYLYFLVFLVLCSGVSASRHACKKFPVYVFPDLVFLISAVGKSHADPPYRFLSVSK